MLFAALAFLWSFGAYAAVTMADGFFLQNLGANLLPQVYLVTALVMFAALSLFLWAFNHIDAWRIYAISLVSILAIIVALALYAGLTTPIPEFWFFLKVFCNGFTVILTTCFWFFLDQYFNAQNSKRLYTLFASAIFLGNGAGSLFLSLGIDYFAVAGVLGTVALFFLASFFWAKYIRQQTTQVFDDLTESSTTPERIRFKQLVKGTIASRFTLLLMGLYLLIQVLNITAELTYMRGFEIAFASSGDNALTIYLSKCTAWISLGNMAFGLFCYSRMIQRIGVNHAVFISPSFFLVAFFAWGFTTSLLVTVFALAIVEGVSYVIDENNSNLLLNSVPSHIKNKARVAIDSFFEPLGMLSASLLFFFSGTSPASLGLVLTLITLAFAFLIRTEYRNAVWKNLREMGLDLRRTFDQWIRLIHPKEKRQSTYELLAILHRQDEHSRLIAFELLLHFDEPKLLSKLLLHAGRLSIKSRLKVVSLLENSRFSKHPEVIERLLLWMREVPGSNLERTIQLYLARLGLLHPERVREGNEIARIYALKNYWAGLSPETISQNHLEAQELLEALLASDRPEKLSAGIEILGKEPSPANFERVLLHLNNPAIEVQQQAAKALELLIEPNDLNSATHLIDVLSGSNNPEMRESCLRALALIVTPEIARPLIAQSLHFRPQERRSLESMILSLGDSICGEICELVADSALHDRCRVLAGRIAAKLNRTLFTEKLYAIIHDELMKAYTAFYHALGDHEWHSDYELHLLRDGLNSCALSSIDLVVQLVALAGGFEESELLSGLLHSTNPKTRATAIETLEKAAESRLWLLLKPLIDDSPLGEKLRHAGRFTESMTPDQLIDWLERMPHDTAKLTSMILRARSGAQGWTNRILELIEGKDTLYHQFAQELIGGQTH